MAIRGQLTTLTWSNERSCCASPTRSSCSCTCGEGGHGVMVSTCASPTRSACRWYLERARDGALERRYIGSRDCISELLGDLPD